MSLRKVSTYFLLCLVLAGCAGHAPQPIATVQPQDVAADCAMITAEIKANNIKIKEIANKRGLKVAQNVVAGAAGFVVPVLWLGMDWQGSAGEEAAALQARQKYLADLAAKRC